MTTYPKSKEWCAKAEDFASNGSEFVLVVHGGAGVMKRESSTPEMQMKYRTELVRALEAGYEVLKAGGEALDAAVAAVTVLEDCPLFNAGKGAVFNVAGKNELEASLMLSKPPTTLQHTYTPTSSTMDARRGTSVTLLTHTKNPSHLVRALYLAPDLVPHPMLSGETAELIGAECLGIQTVDPSYFWTETRWREHRTGLGLPVELESMELPPYVVQTTTTEPKSELGSKVTEAEGDLMSDASVASSANEPLDLMPMGTVGAVALDVRGCLRQQGFLEWAWDRLLGKPIHTLSGVAISGTGDGDYFIRLNVASAIAHRMQYLDEPVAKAAQHVVDDLFKNGGIGGVIAVDRQGNVALPLNGGGMYRGVIRPDGVPLTAIFFDDELSRL